MIVQTLDHNKFNYVDISNQNNEGNTIFVTSSDIEISSYKIINLELPSVSINQNNTTNLINEAINANYAIVILNLYCVSNQLENPPQITINYKANGNITKTINLLNQSENNISDMVKIDCNGASYLSVFIKSSVDCTISSTVNQTILLY